MTSKPLLTGPLQTAAIVPPGTKGTGASADGPTVPPRDMTSAALPLTSPPGKRLVGPHERAPRGEPPVLRRTAVGTSPLAWVAPQQPAAVQPRLSLAAQVQRVKAEATKRRGGAMTTGFTASCGELRSSPSEWSGMPDERTLRLLSVKSALFESMSGGPTMDRLASQAGQPVGDAQRQVLLDRLRSRSVRG